MPEMHSSNTPVLKCRCLHFYSCIAAFSGDANLSKEFSRFISDDQVVASMQQVIAILGDADNTSIKVEVMGDDNLDLFPTAPGSDQKTSNEADDLEHSFRIEMEAVGVASSTKDEYDHNILPDVDILTSSVGATSPTHPSKRNRDELKTEFDGLFHQLSPTSVTPIGGSLLTTSFLTALDWLSSVTEQINMTMHYGMSGYPDPLNFLIPVTFFNFLMDRITNGTTQKKRLPNSTQSIVRSEKPPLGSFTKYTWLLTNIFQLKKVFDTPQVALDVSRKFTRNPDGSYVYQAIKTPLNEIDGDEIKFLSQSPNAKRHRQIKQSRSIEYKTFLKVGQMSSDPRDVTPFTIEWTPDLLPRSRLGELAIKFEFGHQLNGQLDPDMAVTTKMARHLVRGQLET